MDVYQRYYRYKYLNNIYIYTLSSLFPSTYGINGHKVRGWNPPEIKQQMLYQG